MPLGTPRVESFRECTQGTLGKSWYSALFKRYSIANEAHFDTCQWLTPYHIINCVRSPPQSPRLVYITLWSKGPLTVKLACQDGFPGL